MIPVVRHLVLRILAVDLDESQVKLSVSHAIEHVTFKPISAA